MSVPGQCIPMSNLGLANPVNREQLTECAFPMTFVAFRHLSISVTDEIVHMSRGLCIRTRVVCWYQFGNAQATELYLFEPNTCHRTGK